MSEESLSSITRNDILTNYGSIFTPQGAYLVMVGDLTKAQAEKIAATYFGTWKGSKPFKQEYDFKQTTSGNRVIFVNKPGAVQSVISVSFPVDMKPGDKNQLPLTVLNGIFGGGGFGTRLMSNLREDKAYTYGCYSDLQISRDGSSLSASGSFRNDVTDSAIAQLLYEFKRIGEAYVSDEELNLTKSSMAGGFARSLESPQTIARFALNIIQNKLPADFYKTYLQRLSAVDKEAILTMAQLYFTKGYNIVVVGNEDVLAKIMQFDTDGVIEKLDAFGNEVKEKKSADITADQLIEKYLFAATKTTSAKEMAKKLKKVKSVKKDIELSTDQMPIAIKMTEVFVSPNKEAMKIEAQGMTFQSSYYDGTKGAETNMQTGKKEMTSEEIASKKKGEGLFPEMNYKKGGMTFEIQGIETIKGLDYYVLMSSDGQKQQFDYFDKGTYMKFQTVTIQKQGEETVESTIQYGDYKEVGGLLFAHQLSQNFGQMSLSGVVKKIEINGEVNADLFK